MTQDPARRMIKSNLTLFSIIEEIKSRGSARITDLADELGLSNSVVHKHLKSLEEHDLVVKEPDDRYRLGFRFLTYGGYVRDNDEFFRTATSRIKDITGETNESCTFSIEEHGLGIYLQIEWGDHHIPRTQPLGERYHLHSNSSGKAILAELPDERVDEVIDERGLPQLTENTITDRDELFKELDSIRERGYALNEEERFEGIRSIAVSVTHPETNRVGAISIGAPATRLQKGQVLEDYSDLLLRTVNEIELQFQFD